MLRPTTIKVSRTASGLSSIVSRLLLSAGSRFLHLLTVVLLFGCLVGANLVLNTTADQRHLHPVTSYGYLGSFLLYFLRAIPYLSIPFAVTNILGIVTMGTFPLAPTLTVSRQNIPFLCFRVVTRGLYPDLVRRNVQRNMETCYKVGLENFKFEVVTDSPLNLPKSSLVRELVVPSNYVTRYNSLYKARALHYCTEPAVNILSNDDWVVHLDEETLLTESCTIGLANFASENQCDVGQGVITYANEEIVNWWTTLADSIRVTVDFGMMRFCLNKLGCPLMGFKGSFIICRESVEKDIGFDFGPKECIAEDITFALVAWGKGYKFGFVDGEMWEQSTFTIGDYVKQRKRWFVGHWFTLLSGHIPLRCKLGILPTDLGWLLLVGNILNIPLSVVFPIPLPVVLNVVVGSLGGLVIFMFGLGSIKSFSLRKYGLVKKMLILLANIFIIPLAGVLDATASVYGFWSRNSEGFHIVKKEIISLASSENTNEIKVHTQTNDIV